MHSNYAAVTAAITAAVIATVIAAGILAASTAITAVTAVTRLLPFAIIMGCLNWRIIESRVHGTSRRIH